MKLTTILELETEEIKEISRAVRTLRDSAENPSSTSSLSYDQSFALLKSIVEAHMNVAFKKGQSNPLVPVEPHHVPSPTPVARSTQDDPDF